MLHERSTQKRPSRLTVALVAGLALAGVAAACTGGSGDGAATTTSSTLLPPLPPAEAIPVVTVPEGFVVPDTRGALLLPFESRPKAGPPLPVYGGTARLRGVVEGPDGPVGGATVRIERVVGDRVGSITLASAADGSFGADRLLGGHYRARAWLQPNLAATEAAVTFLPANGSAELTITVGRHEGRQLQAVLDVADPRIGTPTRVRALYTERSVDENGVVVGTGVAGAEVRLATDGGFSIGDGPNPATTDDAGIVSWPVECAREGSHTVTVSTQDQSVTATMPSCGPRPSTTTTEPEDDEEEIEVPEFAIGEEFPVPYAGVLPPGTYRTFLNGCETTYQVYVDGEWQPDRRTARGREIALTSPARDFRAAPGTDGCRYQRSA